MLSLASMGFNVNNKFIKEAEIKHGRTAMVAITTIPTLEIINPGTLGIDQFASTPIEYQLVLGGIFGCSEVSQLLNSYNFPREPSGWFTMKESHIPGDYNFNPLNLTSKSKDELFIGRTAMLATSFLMVEELINKNSIF